MPTIQLARTKQRVGATCALRAVMLICAAAAIAGPVPNGFGQTRLPDIATTSALPDAIYWKQDLFLVPYQWSSASEASVAQAVWLYVSKDRGATWQKISEARPQVTSFNYRAEREGEYWFAVRTIDRLGRAWPTGPYQPELRVIVDTTMPQISDVTARSFAHGPVEINWRASDANLDPSSLTFEALVDTAGSWQTIPASDLVVNGISQAMWTPPSGSQPRALRAKILDLAGNPATYQTQIDFDTAGGLAATQPQTLFDSPATLPSNQSPPAGWVSSATAAQAVAPSAPQSQPWAPASTHRAPFRLFSEGPSLPDDGITAYGDLPGITDQQSTASPTQWDDNRISARYASNDPRGFAESAPPSDDGLISHQVSRRVDPVPMPFAPLQPFREASVDRDAISLNNNRPIASAPVGLTYESQHTPPGQPKLVGSRTFALEYDLNDVGRRGITNVELWGTRDGGHTWHYYARDDDHRSPLVVTVDGEGMYGFRIVAESSGAAAKSPNPGDEPELWVAVDLHRPVIELTAIERGDGNLADHLILRWQAADDNLEPRPISLFYSSRPAGPWSAIATNLQDTGEYAWRVGRHVPTRLYLRVEARDIAGNLAAFQIREPIEFDPLLPNGRLRDANSMGPTANGIEPSYR